MERITFDTISSIDEDFDLKYIIVLVNEFTRYVELSKHDVFTIVSADALSVDATCVGLQHLSKSSLILDQFFNQMLTHFHEITGVHYMTIPYSKEENRKSQQKVTGTSVISCLTKES